MVRRVPKLMSQENVLFYFCENEWIWDVLIGENKIYQNKLPC